MTKTMPISITTDAPGKIHNPKSIGQRAARRPAGTTTAGGAARLRHGRGSRAAGHQAGNFACPLPAGHPLGPDQGIRRDRASGNEAREAGLPGKGPAAGLWMHKTTIGPTFYSL